MALPIEKNNVIWGREVSLFPAGRVVKDQLRQEGDHRRESGWKYRSGRIMVGPDNVMSFINES